MMKNKMKFVLIGMVIALAILCCCGCSSKEESYRNIQVLELAGSAKVERADIGEMDAYEGMRLQSGDKISVAEESWLQLRMDEDKYALIEPGSVLTLEATGSSTDSRTVIHLESGAISSRIENELADGSSYEVNTPDSTMAVRGTVFRVELHFDEQGVSYVEVAVYSGKVESRLIHPDGSIDDKDAAVMITDGTRVLISGDDKLTQYVTKGAELELEELALKVLNFLQEAIQADQDLAVSEEEIEELIQILEKSTGETTVYHVVTFVYQDQVFATQTIEHNHAVTSPVLQPSASGSWNFDFTIPITQDTVIDWNAG